MTWELVPPDCHQRNIAKRSIQTFKNHFVAFLSRVDDRFPLSLWCHLIRPAELIVNLLRQSGVVPKISAYAHVHGQHDYMKRLFASLGCVVMAHVKPKNHQSWDVHGNVRFNIGTAMEHHRCFHVYIVKTRATRISNLVFFKHQYITNSQLMPETLVLKAALKLASALKGTVSCEAETADALARVSELFHKIAEAKAATTKAKEQQNTHRTHPNACRAVPLPRVLINPHTQPAVSLPRVQAAPSVDDCRVVGGGSERQIVHTPTQVVGSQLQIVGDKTPRQGKHGPPSAGPNYISQDEDEEHSHGYNTQSCTTSIMQEAMLPCIDITKPIFKILAAKMASQKLPMTWLCEMANSVLGKHGKL